MFDTEPDPGPNPATAMLIHQSMAIFAAPCAALLVAIADQPLRLPPALSPWRAFWQVFRVGFTFDGLRSTLYRGIEAIRIWRCCRLLLRAEPDR